MKRRTFISLPIVLAAGAALAQPTKIRRIGLLMTASAVVYPQVREALQAGLRQEGYVEGQNVTIVLKAAEGKLDRLPALAAELAKENAEVIIALTTAGALAAKSAATDIPMVFVGVGDPVASGLVESLARPGGRITGLSFLTRELTGKRLELLKEAVPKISVVSVLWNPDVGAQARELRDLEAVAPQLGVKLLPFEIRSADDLQQAFDSMAARGTDGLVVLASGLHHQHLRRIADLAVKRRIASICEFSEFTAAGGMLVYGPSFTDMMRRAAGYAAKILNGASPAEMPVEQPSRLQLVVNLKTASAIGSEVAISLLARADEVIE
ncbi:MAG TPA: ABC transporter substrate-binding protein [Alphaproteobacteria bacterium]|nr:ABC transporter substrate-binding protein [Alphaproteobacteria bacterium]